MEVDIADLYKDLFKEDELAGVKAAGHGRRLGFGKKPAIVVVDLNNLCTTGQYALGHGLNTEAVIAANVKLLEAARKKPVPVFFATTNLGPRSTAEEKGVWGEKVGGSTDISEHAAAINPALGLRESEIVVPKPKGSAFFGTPLISMLIYRGVDTLIVTGVNTSGCVRATVVDGCSYNFRVMVPRECCGDRVALPHKVSLFDIDMRFGDVVGLDETIKYLRALPEQ